MDEAPYNSLFKLGDRLILQLLTGDIFEGDYCHGGTNHIDLINTRQHNNPNELGGVYSFYRNEIERIQYLKVKVTQKPTKEEKVGDKDTIKIVEKEYHRLKQMAKEYTYIDKADKRYYDAMDKLVNAENIGVVPLGMEPSRNARVKLLAVCTWQEVFLFDLIEHKHRYFYPELKEIFESEYVCKVLHKGSPLVDILYRNYKIYVQNTFDTQVVDLILQKTSTGQCPNTARNLSECLTHYFNLPQTFINDALKSYDQKWVERPLSDTDKLHASQLVTYLLLLKGQMEKILLSQTYKTIDKVHDFYYDLKPFEYSMTCQKNDISKDLEQLIPSLSAQNLSDNACEQKNVTE